MEMCASLASSASGRTFDFIWIRNLNNRNLSGTSNEIDFTFSRFLWERIKCLWKRWSWCETETLTFVSPSPWNTNNWHTKSTHNVIVTSTFKSTFWYYMCRIWGSRLNDIILWTAKCVIERQKREHTWIWFDPGREYQGLLVKSCCAVEQTILVQFWVAHYDVFGFVVARHMNSILVDL